MWSNVVGNLEAFGLYSNSVLLIDDVGKTPEMIFP